jgi:hypothetical protein
MGVQQPQLQLGAPGAVFVTLCGLSGDTTACASTRRRHPEGVAPLVCALQHMQSQPQGRECSTVLCCINFCTVSAVWCRMETGVVSAHAVLPGGY